MNIGADIAKSEMMTVRLTSEVKNNLDVLARDTKRSRSYLASEAIEAYVSLNAWQVAHIREALAEDEEGGPGVPHECVMEWMGHGGPTTSSCGRNPNDPILYGDYLAQRCP
jgi:predicted transcriptional regulator